MPPPPARSVPKAAIVVVGLALVVAVVVATFGRGETSAEIGARLRTPASTVVLGSSVAQLAIDVEKLPGTVSLAFPATQPAHWLAIVRHHVLGKGHRPARLLLYVPLAGFVNGQLVEESERSALVSLLPWSDPPLETLALGAPIGTADRFHRYRRAVRDGLLAAITDAPALFGVAMPEQAPTAPNAPGGNRPGHIETPRPMPIEQSLTSLLLDEATAAGVRVVVVVPVVNPAAVNEHAQDAQTERAVLAWLRTRPVDVIDLSCLPVPPGEFHTSHHLRERGRPQLTAALATRLDALPAGAADAPGTYTSCQP